MTLYTGTSADGSDMEEFRGLFFDPESGYYSNQLPTEQKRLVRLREKLFEYMHARYSLDDVFNQIKNKSCPLPKSVREYVLSHYDENGELTVGEFK